MLTVSTIARRTVLAMLGVLVVVSAAAFGRGSSPEATDRAAAQAMLPACQSPAQVAPSASDAAAAIPAVAQALRDFDQGIAQFRAMHNLASMSASIGTVVIRSSLEGGEAPGERWPP